MTNRPDCSFPLVLQDNPPDPCPQIAPGWSTINQSINLVSLALIPHASLLDLLSIYQVECCLVSSSRIQRAVSSRASDSREQPCSFAIAVCHGPHGPHSFPLQEAPLAIPRDPTTQLPIVEHAGKRTTSPKLPPTIHSLQQSEIPYYHPTTVPHDDLLGPRCRSNYLRAFPRFIRVNGRLPFAATIIGQGECTIICIEQNGIASCEWTLTRH